MRRSRAVTAGVAPARDRGITRPPYLYVAPCERREYSLRHAAAWREEWEMQMHAAEAVEVVESTPLAQLAALSPDVVYTHVDYLGRELPGPVDLYQRWERQQWSATEIDFEVDRQQWESLPPLSREQIEGGFVGFFY